MAHRRRRTLRARDLPWEGYALAAFGPTLVTLIIPADGSSLLVPALCYLLTVVAAAAVGRIGPGLLAAALSTAGLLFRFVPPINRLSVDTTGELFAVGVFAVTALVVSGVLDRLEAARESSERAVERLTRLQAVTAALSQAVDVEHVTAVVVEQACRELDGQRGTLSVLNEGTRELTLVGAYGLEPDVQAKWHSYPLDGNLPASDAARSRQLVLLQSLHERNQRYPAIAATPPFHDHALACVPLLFEDRVFGVISLSFGGPRPFPEEDCRFLEALGAQCAQALERARLYEAEREAARRQAFLSEASRLLNSSLDYEATLARITRLAVPALADSASVHLFQGEELRLVALAAADPEREHTMRRLSSREDDRANDPTMRQVALSGESILTPEIPHETWAAIAEDDDHRALLEALGTRSALLVSLGGQERRLGLLTLGMNGSSRVFTDDDRSLVEDLAARAGVAIENALSHRARAEQARVLQQSLLPPGLPSIPGLDVAVHYRAAGDGSIVGGDFFDLFRMGERWGVVLGDVSGKGVEAASLTALTRYTVRAVAMTEDRPSAVLSMCNRAVLEADAGEAFCTMVFAVIEQEGDGARVRVAVGGHPLPLCRRATGEIEHVGTTGTAVGLFPDAEFADGEVVLGPQDTLVLFTDGLIEARTPAGDFAPQLLEQTLRASHGAGAAETVAAITTAVGALEEGWARDDMAVVVLTVPEPAPAMRSIRLPGVPALAVVRGDEFVDELVRELELVRLGGRQGVLRTDYPQRLLAVIEDVVSRFARARGSVRDQAEAALAAGEDVFTAEFELPAGAGVALQQTAALLAEVESFARDGLLLTMPRPDDVRAMQDRLLDAIVAQLEGGPASAPWDDGAGGLGALGPSRRTDAGSLPIQAAPDGGERAANLRLARRFLSEVLTRWGVSEDVGEEAALPLSELVTNAVLHTGSDVRMVVRLDASALRIEVHDASAVLPNRRSHDVEAGTGRGLELVEALCERWGVQPTPEGKAVWFEVRV